MNCINCPTKLDPPTCTYWYGANNVGPFCERCDGLIKLHTCFVDKAALASASASPHPEQLRELLDDAFECGHMAWPSPDLPTRKAMRDHAVKTILLRAGEALPASAFPQGFDPSNHHNALACPYCNPDNLSLSKQSPQDSIEAIQQHRAASASPGSGERETGLRGSACEKSRYRFEREAMKIVEGIKHYLMPAMEVEEGGWILGQMLDLAELIQKSALPASERQEPPAQKPKFVRQECVCGHSISMHSTPAGPWHGCKWCPCVKYEADSVAADLAALVERTPEGTK